MLELKLAPSVGFGLDLKPTDGGLAELKLTTELTPALTLSLAPFFRGERGSSGSSNVEIIAGEAIGGHRVVLQLGDRAYYATNENAQHGMRVLGITENAATLGDTLSVIRAGTIAEPSWNLDVESPVFLGVNGLITQTAPVTPSAFSLIIGFPISSTEIFVSLREPISSGV